MKIYPDCIVIDSKLGDVFSTNSDPKEEESLLDQYFPPDSCGYVRKFDQRDLDHKGYEPNWYGFFSPYGDLISCSDVKALLYAEIYKRDFVVYSLH